MGTTSLSMNDCHVSGFNSYGLYIDAGNVVHTIKNSTFTGSDRGISVRDYTDISFDNCEFTDNTHGIWFYYYNQATIEGCLFQDNSQYGIKCELSLIHI